MTQREAQEMSDRATADLQRVRDRLAELVVSATNVSTADLQRVRDRLAELRVEETRLENAWRELRESLRAEGWFIPLDGIVRRDWRRTRAFAHGAR